MSVKLCRSAPLLFPVFQGQNERRVLVSVDAVRLLPLFNKRTSSAPDTHVVCFFCGVGTQHAENCSRFPPGNVQVATKDKRVQDKNNSRLQRDRRHDGTPLSYLFYLLNVIIIDSCENEHQQGCDFKLTINTNVLQRLKTDQERHASSFKYL